MNIKNISKTLSKKFIKDKIERLNLSYKSMLKKKPKIAVLGLNPHLNELKNNSEEQKEIIPAIKELKRKKLNICGPYSVDELFLNYPNKYDVIVGMYHDQVLGPFKALFGFDAINITLGLDFIRVSPDHGTAKGIILKNKANPKSLQKAINFLLKFNG
jgi:4-hydroxythreonine-4-phosphate dehydrogenase